MKKPTVVSIVLFTILAISVLEASSENIGTCKQNDRLCFEDLECCSGNCRRFFTFKKYCKTSIIETVKQFISPKIDGAMCYSFNSSKTVLPNYMEKSEALLTAAKPTVSLNSVIEVTHENKQVLVKVKERVINETQDLVLYISEEAANRIGMPLDTLTPCKLRKPATENWFILRNFNVVIPIFAVFLWWILFKQFVVHVTFRLGS